MIAVLCEPVGAIWRAHQQAFDQPDPLGGYDRDIDHVTGRPIIALEQRNHARSFLKKAEEYLAFTQDNLDLERYTPAGGANTTLGAARRTPSWCL